MSKDTGGPAFPQITELGDIAATSNGMTLRDYFAAKAMQGLVTTSLKSDDSQTHPLTLLSDGLSFSGGWRGRVAVAAYAMADTMLAERDK